MKKISEPAAAPRYHHGDLRRALLEAAAQVSDIEQISLRELASGLGVTAAAVYRHFDSREALLAELAVGGFEKLKARFAATFDLATSPADAPQAIDRLQRLGGAYLSFADEQPALWRLMFGAYAAKTRADSLQGASPTSYSYLLAALQGLFSTRAIAGPPTEEDVLFTWSTIHGVAALRVGDVVAALGDVEQVTVAVMHRVFGGLGVKLPPPAGSCESTDAGEASDEQVSPRRRTRTARRTNE